MNAVKNIYLIGAGGIGMSALGRYFLQHGVQVKGYDRVATKLTGQLEEEGMKIYFEDDEKNVYQQADLVIYTPAIPKDSKILNWYKASGIPMFKRSEVLQEITKSKECIAIAGTHGKTTITSMVAHLFRYAEMSSCAFLGGISVNYNSNFWKIQDGNIAIVEADEYDRSFLKLTPRVAVLTSMDADHLDIYGSLESLQEAFVEYTQNIEEQGRLWYKFGLPSSRFKAPSMKSYSLQNDSADVYAADIQSKNGSYIFDWKNNEDLTIERVRLHIGGLHNVENAVVAMAIALEYGIDSEIVKEGIEKYRGVKRRFEYVVKNEKVVYIDDYAHHPKELESLIMSAKRLFPGRKCTIAFQPHLYSRTKDLANDFSKSLNLADEVILLPIYPAREEPIEGVSSEVLKSKMEHPVCTVLSKEGLLRYVTEAPLEVFITAGAGNIDLLVEPIKNILENK